MDVLIFGILRYLTKETCKSDHIIICSFRGWVSWSKYCFLIDYLSFPLGILPQWSRNRATYLLNSRLSPWENKQTNKHPRSNFAQPFFPKFSCVLQLSQEKLKTLLTLTQFCLGEENGGDKQVLLMIQRRLAGVRLSVPLKTLSLHVFFFNSFLFLVCPFWSGSGMIFEGTTGVDERIYGFNSKWVRTNSKWILRNRFF